MREEAKRWKVTPRSGWYDLAAWPGRHAGGDKIGTADVAGDTPGDLRRPCNIDQREMRTHELFFRPGL